MNRVLKAVIKIEIETLFDSNNELSSSKMEYISMVCANLHNSGVQTMLVSSGAIALGALKLKLPQEPVSITRKQAIAAVGQTELINAYQKHFDDFNQIAAQVLITRDVVDNPIRNKNAKNTLLRLLDKGIIPIVNENDSVSTNDIIIKDNYPLAVIVASLTDSDAIVVNTPERNKFFLIIKNRSAIADISVDELLDLDNTISKITKKFGADDIVGFPELPAKGVFMKP